MSRCFLALMFALVVCAQESPPQYHFVFIVDTSISMADRKAAVLSAMRDLFRSSFSGQIEDGDVIDVWTCETPKDPDAFSPILWFGRRGGAISLHASEYISEKKFHRGERLAEALAELAPALVNTTGFLVVLLTDGEEPVTGFSFDAELNQEIAKVRRDATRAKKPIIVALSAVDGEWSDWKVKVGTDHPDLPRLPKREKAPPPPQQIAPKEATNVVEKASEPEPPPPVVFNYPPGAKVMASVSPSFETPVVNPAPPSRPKEEPLKTPPPPLNIPEPPVESLAPQTNTLTSARTNNIRTDPTSAVNTVIVALTLPTNSPVTTPEKKASSAATTGSDANSRSASFHVPAVYVFASAGSICVLTAGLLAVRRPSRAQKGSFISRSLAK
jgi:hypothetical protein